MLFKNLEIKIKILQVIKKDIKKIWDFFSNLTNNFTRIQFYLYTFSLILVKTRKCVFSHENEILEIIFKKDLREGKKKERLKKERKKEKLLSNLSYLYIK